MMFIKIIDEKIVIHLKIYLTKLIIKFIIRSKAFIKEEKRCKQVKDKSIKKGF